MIVCIIVAALSLNSDAGETGGEEGGFLTPQ